MATHIVIRHLGGAKINQIEQFPVDGLGELTIGREPGMTIRFDPLRDDLVSRRHAAIAITPGDPPRFKLRDLGSSNGTLLNGMRITGESELLAGDEIELGSGGPKFVFDLDPRPERMVARTRMISPPELTTATRMIDTGAGEPGSTTTVPPTAEHSPSSVGRNTVMRLLSDHRQSQTRLAMYGLAGVLVLIAAVAGAIYLQNQRDIARQQAAQAALARETAAAEAAAKAKTAELAAQLEKQKGVLGQEAAAIGLSPEQIAAKYGNATVRISLQWKLKDQLTGRPVFEKMIQVPLPDGTATLPAFVDIEGAVVPWLTTDDDNRENKVIGAAGSGSGFVVSDDGFIMTNKHVAAGWMVAYDGFDQPDAPGIVFDMQSPGVSGALFHALLECQFTEVFAKQIPAACRKFAKIGQVFAVKKIADLHLKAWFPGLDGGILFYDDRPVPVAGGKRVFDGSSDEVLDVRFPGSRVGVSANFVRASTDADAALIKVAATEKLDAVPLAPDDKVETGEQVVVLGYPSFTPETVAGKEVIEGGKIHDVVEEVPRPTVTSGIISNVSLPLQRRGDIVIGTSGGDAYQLTVPSTHGNSGGPVFNRKGQVIGLFTYGTARESVTYAIPIRYARDLLQMQQH